MRRKNYVQPPWVYDYVLSCPPSSPRLEKKKEKRGEKCKTIFADQKSTIDSFYYGQGMGYVNCLPSAFWRSCLALSQRLETERTKETNCRVKNDRNVNLLGFKDPNNCCFCRAFYVLTTPQLKRKKSNYVFHFSQIWI